MSYDIFISASGPREASVKGKSLDADVTLDYCLVNLRNQTMRLNPEDYRGMEVIIELAKQIRAEAGLYDDDKE